MNVEDGSKPKRITDEFNRLQAHLESLEEQIDELTSSKSWKITRPLRTGKLILNFLAGYLSFGAMRLVAGELHDLAQKNSRFFKTGPRPSFFLRAKSRWRLPAGWVEFSWEQTDTPAVDFILYVDDGNGLSEDLAIPLNFSKQRTNLVKLPALVRRLRLDPCTKESFEFNAIKSKLRWSITVLWRHLDSRDAVRRSSLEKLKDIVKFNFTNESVFVSRKILRWKISRVDFNRAYERWIKRHDTLSEVDRNEIRTVISSWQNPPMISVLMPVYNTTPRWLRRAIESVRSQLYQGWELCIVDDGSSRPEVARIVAEYALLDPRIRVVRRAENGHISVASNDALAMAGGPFIALMDHDDELSEHALYHVVEALVRQPDLDLIYSDEDRITATGKRRDPYFKSDWNPELMFSQNMISHLGIYRTSKARSIGGFRVGFEGSQDWDFALRFVEVTSPEKIGHIAKVLYHWRLVPGTVSFNPETKIDALAAAGRAVGDHLRREMISADIKEEAPFGVRIEVRMPGAAALPSLIIAAAKESGFATILAEDARRLGCRVTVPGENWRAVAADMMSAKVDSGTWLLGIGANITNIVPGSLEAMVSASSRKGVGAVGSVTINEDQVIRQAGLTVGRHFGVAPLFEGFEDGDPGYFGIDRRLRQIGAIGSDLFLLNCAALMEIGGMDAQFGNLGVVDACVRLRGLGYGILIEPRARCTVPGQQAPIPAGELLKFKSKWPELSDPFYNPNLSPSDGGYFFKM